MTLLIDDIQSAINRHSAENVSNTPDYVLAQFLVKALAAFDHATNTRALHMSDRTAPDTGPKQAATTTAPSVEPENKQLDDQLTGKLTDQAIEDYVKANGLNAPRVTLAEFDANIVHTEVLKHVTHSGQVLRWATLTTRNGFAVTGRPSCSASSENDNPPLGTKVAIDNARAELWPLMGYALRERLASTTVAHHPV